MRVPFVAQLPSAAHLVDSDGEHREGPVSVDVQAQEVLEVLDAQGRIGLVGVESQAVGDLQVGGEAKRSAQSPQHCDEDQEGGDGAQPLQAERRGEAGRADHECAGRRQL